MKQSGLSKAGWRLGGHGPVRQQPSLRKGPWGQTAEQVQAAWACMPRASGREWKMVMKELIASSGFWNRTPAPSAWARAACKWNIDDYGENKGKWPRYMIDLKATDLCRTCLNRQYISPGFYGSVYTYCSFRNCWGAQILHDINFLSPLFTVAAPNW